MTTPPSQPTEFQILGAPATNALKAALRAKKKKTGSVLVRHERDLIAFAPKDWIRYCVARAQGLDAQFAAHAGQYLGQIFAVNAAWGPEDYANHLRAIAGTLEDNLAHPMGSTPEQQAPIYDLYETIPKNIRERVSHDQETPDVDVALIHKPKSS